MSRESNNIGSVSVPHKLKELCAMHPNDPIFHIQLAEYFLKVNHEIRAIHTAKKAYNLLINQHPLEANALIDKFGSEITSNSTNPLVSVSYSPLSDSFGRIAMSRKKVKLKEEGILFRKGEEADFIYLVLDGELAVSNGIGNNLSLINYLHAGDLVGEGALLDTPARSATIIANKKSVLLKFTPKELEKSFEKHPDLHMQFSKESILRRRVAELSACHAFSCLPTDLRFMIAKRAWSTTHPAGTTIKRPNKFMPYVELIVSGTVHLYDETSQKEKLYCGSLSDNEILGLHKIMAGQTSKLSYTAKTSCEVICMDFELIEDVMEVSSRFRQRIRDTAAKFSTQITRTFSLQKH